MPMLCPPLPIHPSRVHNDAAADPLARAAEEGVRAIGVETEEDEPGLGVVGQLGEALREARC